MGTAKVLHILHAFKAGGLENGLVHIINGSPVHLQHELCVMTEIGDFRHRLQRPVVFHELGKRPGNDPSVALRIRKIISESRPQIVHTRNWAAFDGVLAALFTPGVRVIHGEHGRDLSDPEGLNRRRNVFRRLMQFRVDKFVAVSADLLRWLRDVIHIKPAKLQLITNGVDTNRFCPGRKPGLREKLGLTTDDFIVGSIGRLDPVKNHEGLIRAIHQLEQRGRRLRLMIIGDGPNKQNLELLVKARQWNDQPFLMPAQLAVEDFYGLFDIFVLNSFAEGMSNTILEAMACGLPTICTNIGGNSELIENDRSGKLVPVEDESLLATKISEYQDSAELRQTHGGYARKQVVEHHSLDRMISKYVQLYGAANPNLAPL